MRNITEDQNSTINLGIAQAMEDICAQLKGTYGDDHIAYNEAGRLPNTFTLTLANGRTIEVHVSEVLG